MENQIQTAQYIASQLLQINAIRLSPQKPFTWSSGLKSPIYCDNRMVLSHPAVRGYIIDSFVEKSQQFKKFNYIAGVATAGIAHASLIADRMELPMVYVRSKAKSHGRQNLIEGDLKPSAKVLLIEDLISTGGSSLRAVEALQAAGAEVVGVMAIFSYGFSSAVEAFKKAACPLITLTSFDVLVREAVSFQLIEEKYISHLRQWSENPQLWSEQFTD